MSRDGAAPEQRPVVLGGIEGWGRVRDTRDAYESALASCRTAELTPSALATPAPAAAPPAAPEVEATTLSD